MLLSLLPGLRDLRTPLGVGYLWLAVGWLLFRDAVPTRSDAQGLVASLYRLGDSLGAAAGLGALTFVAYVLGSVLSLQFLVRGGLGRIWESRRSTPEAVLSAQRARRAGFGFVDDATFDALLATIRIRVRAAMANDPQSMRRILDVAGLPASDPADVEGIRAVIALYRRLQGELGELVTALLLHEKDRLWDNYDRKSAEAEFRQAVAVPLTALIICAALTASPWFWLGLPVSLTFFYQGERRGQEARSEVYQALAHGVVDSTTLDQIAERPAPDEPRPPRPTGIARP